MLESPVVSVLGKDPDREHRINANSFQQDAIVTSHGWQYAAFYSKPHHSNSNSPIYVHLSRRKLRCSKDEEFDSSRWQTIIFEDYEQIMDDGHNTISIGVCEGDGTIHMAFDHHCDGLHFRISQPGIALDPTAFTWDLDLFSEVQNSFPGLIMTSLLQEVTYPRFVKTGDDMLLSWRIGMAGAGSDVLALYSSQAQSYKFLGTHLTGVSNNPYVNGIDYAFNRLHISWTYRRFFEYNEANDTTSTLHKTQAGPNGPENNYDLNYAYSDDRGLGWYNTLGERIGMMTYGQSSEKTILPTSKGIRVFEIPMRSGILNQEGQCTDSSGGFHVLNRENLTGEERWVVYSRRYSGEWNKSVADTGDLKPSNAGSRGSICADGHSLYLILPGNYDSSLNIFRASIKDKLLNFEKVWSADGYDGEPLYDVHRLQNDHILSIFTRTQRGADGERTVIVLDFHIDS